MSIPPTIEVASLGMWDSLILMVMALVVFGPRRMPEIGRQIGRLMYELRKASSDFKFQMEEELRNAEEADRRKKDNAQLQALTSAAPTGTVEASQVPESGPEAPTAIEGYATSTESPYAGEEQYPPVYPSVTPPETQADETALSGSAAAETSSPAAAEASSAEAKTIEDPSSTPGQTPTEPVKENG
jgi:sec-independent protein translocase protein TatB